MIVNSLDIRFVIINSVDVTDRMVNASMHLHQDHIRTNNDGSKLLIKFDSTDTFAKDTFADSLWCTEQMVKDDI